jgi:hypothetical protein
MPTPVEREKPEFESNPFYSFIGYFICIIICLCATKSGGTDRVEACELVGRH